MYSVNMIFTDAVSPKTIQCEAYCRRHSGATPRRNNEAMDRFWADPKGAKQAALCKGAASRLHRLDVVGMPHQPLCLRRRASGAPAV